MSLATIIKKIEDEAQTYGQKLIDKAGTEGEQIIAHGREEAESEAAGILRQTEEELQNFKNKQMATALLQVRKEKLDKRQQILKEVFSKALERILDCDVEQYRTIMKHILLSVQEEIEGNILPAQADKQLFTQEFVKEINAELAKQNRALRFQISSKTAEIKRGCILDFQDFEINYSLEKILSGLWDTIKSDVITRLFEDGNN